MKSGLHQTFIVAYSCLAHNIYLQSCFSEYEENTTSITNYTDYSIPTVDYDDFPEVCVKDSNRRFRLWFISTFYSIICFLGLAGNLLVILTFFYFKRLKTMTDVFLLNLSFADLIFALSLPFWAANSMAEWVLGLLVCKAMHTVYKVSFYSSMFILSFISVDRYFSIAKAVAAHRHRSQAMFLSKVSSVLVWAMALIFSIPDMKYTAINNNTCTPYSSNTDKLRVSLQASQIVLGFFLPLLVMSFCYSCIVRTLCQARNFERNKAIKVILAVVIVFLVCQMPYNIILFWMTVVTVNGGTEDCNYENKLLYAADITQCVAFLRCCLNPFVYAFIGVKFRHDLLKLLKDFGCMSQERFFRVGQTIRLDSAQETVGQHPSLTEASLNHVDADLEISLGNLNQLILELDPTFEPIPVNQSPTCTSPPTDNSCSDEDVSHCMLVPRGCAPCSSPTVVPSVSPSIPIPTHTSTSCSPHGTLVFSSSPTSSLPPLPCGSAPRRNPSPKPDATSSQGSLRLSHSNRNSAVSLLSMSTCSDTSYILGSNLSLASEDADSPESNLTFMSNSFTDGSKTKPFENRHSPDKPPLTKRGHLQEPHHKGAHSSPASLSGSLTDIPVLLINGAPQPDLCSPSPGPDTDKTSKPFPPRSFQAHFNGSQPSMKFVMDTSKFWFRPHISRAEAESLIQDKEAGTFVVRDSSSFRGSFGLAMKVDQTSANSTANAYPDAIGRYKGILEEQ
ncbi:hypothetical protein L3Q82_005220 [Scortum barcoo]|uniref:Uncharacterized protein n=1 Tax=Scortum barcoo TaxID=214431 RepID=A0ACB8V9V6_9TELE|nr:hypothetical protein L3Q82_005220 [Scortum barcoo]